MRPNRNKPPNITKLSPDTTKQKSERGKSVIVVPSRVVSHSDDIEHGEETEIAAQISVPYEGGWGWVVVGASFWCIFILDGVAFTFGSVYTEITEELEMQPSLVALINSIAVALYFSVGPLTSALINRFGFRAVVMSGAAIVAIALLCTYFSTSFAAICLFYGGIAGVGYCFINMSSALIVGFYFERLRSLALAIATTGSSIGIMVMFPLNSYLVKLAGWRTVILLQSGLFGIVFFLGMTYKPLIYLTVTQTTDRSDPTRTVTYLPNLSTPIKAAPSRAKAGGLMPTATEKLFSAVSNYNFPTAAAVVEEGTKEVSTSNQTGVPGPSIAAVSKITLTAHPPQGGMSQRHIMQVQSIISRSNDQDRINRILKVNVEGTEKKKVSCWGRLCPWEQHIPQARPMYRDDAFFDGKIETLPAYQKSRMDTATDQKTGLEYQLAVSRAVTAADLQEKRGVFTTAARRILATMMDPKLLKRPSFLMFSSGGFFIYLGFLVPYIFVSDRNKAAGIDDFHCNWFVSAIGFANAFGRLVLGALACKISPLKLFSASCVIAGSATMLSNISYNVYYQYFYCSMYGFFIACLACLRSMVLVDLYGLEKLTNATGMMLLFQGLGSCISTPAASMINTTFGVSITFYVAGLFILISGICFIPIKKLSEREERKETENPKSKKQSQNQEVSFKSSK